ncbi:THAP domain-containing protein 9, partial [Cyphomyrmex costatus]
FPAALKEFSCTLLFYSASAYEYVRSKFINCLPHPKSLRKCSEYEKKLQFGLQVDEMSIKNHVDWDDRATYALVFMLVALNGHFKTPIAQVVTAYYLIRSLTGKERANIVNQILQILSDHEINDIRSITFDGASTNLSMIESLGAKIRDIDMEPSFDHPVTGEPIFAIPDACHMLKLVRNVLDKFDLIDGDGNRIKWDFLVKLVERQEKEGVHLGTKITSRHINFYNEKMKVKLAAQVFITRVADALIFLEQDLNVLEFAGANATATFCRNINNIFDFLNSKQKFGKHEFQKCISAENIKELETKINDFINYIKSLKIYDKSTGTMLVLNHKKKIGFWGLIVAMKSEIKLATFLLNKKLISYLLTYKLSPDHLETFFSCIRRMGGFNNNPTCRQFKTAYKKLITHVNCLISEGSNCTIQDETKILQSGTTTNTALNVIEIENDPEISQSFFISLDHDYETSNSWSWNE